MKYQAFISYNHNADSLVASALQSGLHRFAKPFYKLRALRIFRDQASATLTPHLWPLIQEALQDSEFFILLASTGAAGSPWVNKEVDEWFKLKEGSLDNFLIVLTDGAIKWDDASNDFDWENTTALPQSLRGKFHHEPLWLDLSWIEKSTDSSLRDPRFLDGIATLGAAIHKQPKDIMVGEDVKQHRRFRRAAVTTVCVLVALVLLASGAGYYANAQRNVADVRTKEAIEQRTEAERQQQIAVDLANKEREATERANKEAEEAKRQKQLADTNATEAAKQRDFAREQQALAEERSHLAQSRALAAEARQPTSQEIDGSLIKSAHAFKESPTVEARAALLEVFSKSRSLVRFFRCQDGHHAASVAFSEDGKRLGYICTSSTSATIAITSTADHRLIFNRTIDGDARKLIFLTDNLVAVGGQRDLRLLDLNDGRMVTFPGHLASISALSISPEQTILFTGDWYDEVRVWEIDELHQGRAIGVPLRQNDRPQAGRYGVSSIEYLESARSLLVKFNDKTEWLIDKSAWHKHQIKQSTIPGWLSPSNANGVHLSNPDLETVPPCLDKYPRITRSFVSDVVSNDRKWHAYATEENEVIVFNQSGCLPPLVGHTHNISELAFGRRQNNLFASAGEIGKSHHGVLLWNINQQHPLGAKLAGSPRSAFSRKKLALSENGESWACVGCADLILWDGAPLDLHRFQGPQSTLQPGPSLHSVTSLTISENKMNLAIGFEDGNTLIATRKVNGEIETVAGPKLRTSVMSSGFTRSGELYAVGRDGQSIRWQKNSLVSSQELKNFPKEPECFALRGNRPNLTVAAYSSQLKPSVWFYDLRTGSGFSVELPPGRGLAQGGGGCSGLGYTPAARLAVRTSSGYQPIYFIASSPKPNVSDLENPLHAPSGLPTTLGDAQLSSDGKLLVTSSQNKAIAIFDVPTKRLIGTIELDGLMSLVLSADGKRLITLSDAGVIQWNLDASTWARQALQIANSDQLRSIQRYSTH